MDVCIECKKPNSLLMDESEGTIVCTLCGRVNVVKIIDDTAEWRNFQDDEGEDPRRVGMPNNDLLGDKGLGTTISDSALKRWGQRSQFSSLDSALLKTFIEIENVCNSLALPASISEKSKKLFKNLYVKKLTKGKSHMGVVCACIFISCRKMHNKCPVFDIARECSVDKTKLYKAYLLVREHTIDIFPLSSAQKLASEYAEKLNFSEDKVKKVHKIIEELVEYNSYNEKDEVLAILGVFLVDALVRGVCHTEIYTEISGVKEDVIVMNYREVFIKRYKIMQNLATSWELANMPNI